MGLRVMLASFADIIRGGGFTDNDERWQDYIECWTVESIAWRVMIVG